MKTVWLKRETIGVWFWPFCGTIFVCVVVCVFVLSKWVSMGVRITRCKFTKFPFFKWCLDLLLPNKNNKYKQKLNGRREVWRNLKQWNRDSIGPSFTSPFPFHRIVNSYDWMGFCLTWLDYINYRVNFTGNIISFYESLRSEFWRGGGGSLNQQFCCHILLRRNNKGSN